jgi:hypothetical protein
MATFFKFNAFKEDVYEGVHKFQSDTLKVYLTNATPDAALDAVKADLAEITNENGYTAPVALTGVTSTLNGATYELSAADLTTAGAGAMVTATGSVGPFQHVVLYNDTTTDKVDPLIGCWSYATPITMSNGEKFEVDFGATILTHT